MVTQVDAPVFSRKRVIFLQNDRTRGQTAVPFFFPVTAFELW